MPSERLEPHGTAARIEYFAPFVDGSTVYATRGMDPATVLVMRFNQELAMRWVFPSASSFFSYVDGAPGRASCPYFDRVGDAIPTVCQ